MALWLNILVAAKWLVRVLEMRAMTSPIGGKLFAARARITFGLTVAVDIDARVLPFAQRGAFFFAAKRSIRVGTKLIVAVLVDVPLVCGHLNLIAIALPTSCKIT